MAVNALENNLLTVDEHTVFPVAIVLVAVFNGTETKLLPLHMEGLSLLVLQGKDGSIEVRLLCIPCLHVIHAELHLRLVAADDIGRTGAHLCPLGVNDVDAY